MVINVLGGLNKIFEEPQIHTVQVKLTIKENSLRFNQKLRLDIELSGTAIS